MTTRTGSAVPAFVIAGISVVLAVVYGVETLGKPLRLVNLVTIIGSSMTAGVSWMQAVLRARQQRLGDHVDQNTKR
jgi:hypothetical protein